MTSPEKSTRRTVVGTRYSKPFMIETKHIAETAQMSVVAWESAR